MERNRYRQANSVVFAALPAAVRDIPVIGDKVRRLHGGDESAKESWLKIKSHFVRLADTNHTFLLKRLHELEPRESESMESLLNRCYQLREDFLSYDLELDDKLLITQVFSKLSYQWKLTTGIAGISVDQLSWDEVAIALQSQDNARRQSNTTAADALFPLGWTRRNKGEGKAKKAGSPPREKKEEAGGKQPKPAGGGKKKGNPGKNPRGPLVCFCCSGEHMWHKCPELPEGWNPTPEDREKAWAIENKKAQAARFKGKGKARAAEGDSESECSDPSEDGFCNGAL